MASIRVPTSAELEQINKFVPSGYAPITADEVGIVSVVVANNLLTYDYQKWAIADLSIMPAMLVGKQATLNHESWAVEKVYGKIFNASVANQRTLPIATIKSSNGYQSDTNQAIVKKEGYTAVIADIYYPISPAENTSVLPQIIGEPLNIIANPTDAMSVQVAAIAKRLNEVVSAMLVTADTEESEEDAYCVGNRIRFSLYDRVSLGSFDYEALRCPECNCEKGFALDMFSKSSCNLGYLIPEPDYGLEPNAIIESWEGDKKVAPYTVRTGLRSLEEVSFVVAGNLPLASTVKGTI